ncbi:hypothetical protein Q9233_006304 [Columba guinea]|nr:hypothetical protein Q9233_006304 [Columba guinea]
MQKSGTNQEPILTPGYIQGGSSMSVRFPQVNDAESTVAVEFTPTIPHCSMATLIGLSIKVKLIRSLPERFKLQVLLDHKQLCGLTCDNVPALTGDCNSAASLAAAELQVYLGAIAASETSESCSAPFP